MHDMGGALWENREGYARWDPSASVGEWATPQLVIHSELDYRLSISEGLSAFNGTQPPRAGVECHGIYVCGANDVTQPFRRAVFRAVS